MGHTPPAETGLLEQAVLLVRAEPRRRVLLSAAGQVIGYTSWRRDGWFRWVLELHEQDQSPLVCTIRRRLGWPKRREVRDAEGELVGFVTGGHILDRWERVALRFRDGCFVGERGAVLARWGGGQLELLEGVRHDPFAKMLLVAAAVAD